MAPYTDFLTALRKAGFEGDLTEAMSDRVVLATDNSIYQVLSEAVAFPRNTADLQRIARLLTDPRFGQIVLRPRGGGTGTNGQSLGSELVALAQIAEFHAEHAILTVGALDADGITDFDLQEAEIARAMVDRARTLTVVADHTKFGRRAVFSVASLERINRIVTDRAPDAALATALKAQSVSLIMPSDELAPGRDDAGLDF